jgi:hypothetical protein
MLSRLLRLVVNVVVLEALQVGLDALALSFMLGLEPTHPER